MKYSIGLTLTTLNTQINKPLNKCNKKIDSALKSHLRTFINKFNFPIICFYVKERTKRGLEHLHIHIYSNKDMLNNLKKHYNKQAITETLNIKYLAKNYDRDGYRVSYIKGVQSVKKLYLMTNKHSKKYKYEKLINNVKKRFYNSREYYANENDKDKNKETYLKTDKTRPAKINFCIDTLYLSRNVNKKQVRTQKKISVFTWNSWITPIINKTNRYYNKKLASIYCHIELKKLQLKIIEYIERLIKLTSSYKIIDNNNFFNIMTYRKVDIKDIVIFLHNFFKEKT